ncbi:hypothetical protein DDE23_13380 [Pararhodobacter aggregans]|uniref:Uncharacterized protein n=2 Tax=Pararhodobacter aggregans TaxID=404875 RepID=A0A2T7URC0_9RHOB|nr:hypothetical protein C8N33_106271 [Pararhodobacter aggregans]PVE47227.1 hypothetical protein DDE23_13380 [Pararhodobacter aggregans]
MAAAVAQIASIKRAMVRRLAGNLGIARPGDDEDQRLQFMLDAARAPESCGPEIPVAPARGRVLSFAPQAVRPTATGYEVQHDGFRGRDAARAADVFDVMLHQVARRGGEAPFTPGQIEAGRTYAMLVERHSSVGLRCISVESQRGSGSAGGAFMDAVLAEGEVIRRMQAAIGTGMALEVLRETGARRDIPVRRLVDMVCLEGKSVTAALKAHGWSVYGDIRAQAYAAVGDALDRMRAAAPGR